MIRLIAVPILVMLSFCGSINAPSHEIAPDVSSTTASNAKSARTDTTSEVDLTFKMAESVWNRNTPLVVKFSFENLSEDEIKLSNGVNFLLTHKPNDDKIKSVDLGSSVSLNKVYDEKFNGCQNDLTPDRFTESGGITSSKSTVVLEKGLKKAFSFDLNKVCWAEMRSSVYPNQNLSSIVKPGKYTIYFWAAFDTGKIIDTPDKYDATTNRSIESDKLEIEIK